MDSTLLTHEVWSKGVQDFEENSGGVFSLSVVDGDNVAELLQRSLEETDLRPIFIGVVTFLERVSTAVEGSGPTCAGCEIPVKDVKFSVVIVTPECDQPTNLLTLGVCASCAPGASEAKTVATLALRAIWPDLRSVNTPHPVAGHA